MPYLILDRLTQETKFRFIKFSNRVSTLLCLTPSIICSPDMNLDFVSEYKEDFPNNEIADQVICLWKQHWLAQTEESRPSTLAKSLKECKTNRFPNLYVLSKIGCTLPVTSCECERSFSAMRRLRTWFRTSLSSQRISELVIINIHRYYSVNYTTIVKRIFILHPRQFNFANLSFF